MVSCDLVIMEVFCWCERCCAISISQPLRKFHNMLDVVLCQPKSPYTWIKLEVIGSFRIYERSSISICAVGSVKQNLGNKTRQKCSKINQVRIRRIVKRLKKRFCEFEKKNIVVLIFIFFPGVQSLSFLNILRSADDRPPLSSSLSCLLRI